MRWSRTVYVNITDSQISVERPDVGHGITYRDGGESCTFCEFASFFISTTYTLKGRKVKSKNLQLIIKSKI